MDVPVGGTGPRRGTGQRGFTLLELLVTVAILGVVSGVAVLGVAQLTDGAERSACDVEARTITVAQEAHKVRVGAYGDLDAIVGAGLLSERPGSHDVQLVPGGWQLVALGACAGGADELAADRDGGPGGTATDGAVSNEDVGAGDDVPSVDSPLQRRSERGQRSSEAPGVEEHGRGEEAAQDPPRVEDDAPGSSTCRHGQVDLNRASTDQLARIVHVNPGRAIQIERGRPFVSVKDLERVNGLHDRHVEEIVHEGLACV